MMNNTYFWLGADGELEELTEEEFEQKQSDIREDERKWRAVDCRAIWSNDTSEGQGGGRSSPTSVISDGDSPESGKAAGGV